MEEAPKLVIVSGLYGHFYLTGQEFPLNSKPRSYANFGELVDVSLGCLLIDIEDF